MKIRELEQLNRDLLNSEFDTAKAIYEQARAQGYGPLNAAALCYRHGYIDGKAKDAEKVKKPTNSIMSLKKCTMPTKRT